MGYYYTWVCAFVAVANPMAGGSSPSPTGSPKGSYYAPTRAPTRRTYYAPTVVESYAPTPAVDLVVEARAGHVQQADAVLAVAITN